MNWMFAQAEPPKTSIWGIERTVGPLFSQPVFWWILATFIVTILLLFALSRIPSNFRKFVTVGITFLAGMFYVLEWLLPRARTAGGEAITPVFGLFNYEEAGPIISSIAQVLTGMLLALGVMSIFRVHFGRLFKRQKDWFFSAVLLVSLFAMFILGLFNFAGDRDVERGQASVDAVLNAKPPERAAMTDEYARLARLGIESAADSQYEAKFDAAVRRYGLRELSDKWKAQVPVAMTENAALKAQRDEDLATARADIDKFNAAETKKIDDAASSGTLTADVANYVRAGISAEKERRPAVQGFNLLFGRGLLAMDAAMFSLIGFFILSAAYRAFRIRSIEASILMATALIVLLSFVPIALMLTNGLDINGFEGNFRIENIGMWLLTTINVPAIRAIDLGLGLGLLAMALRIMLGLERGVASE